MEKENIEEFLKKLNDIELQKFLEYYFYKIEDKIQLMKDEKLIEKCVIMCPKDRRARLVFLIPNEDLQLKMLQYIKENDGNIVFIAERFQNEKNIATATKYVKDKLKREKLLYLLKSDEALLEALQYLTLKEQIHVITRVNDDNIKTAFIKGLDSENAITFILTSLKNDNIKLQFLPMIKEEENKAFIIESLESIEKRIEEFHKITNEYCKGIIINSIKDDTIKIQLINGLKDEKIKAGCIANIKDRKILLIELSKLTEEDNIAIASENLSEEDKLIIVKGLKEEEAKKNILKNIYLEDENEMKSFMEKNKLESDIIRILRQSGRFDKKFVWNNIQDFIKIESSNSEKIRIDIFNELSKKDDCIIETINYDFLQERFIDLFSEEQFYRIAKSSDFQNNLIKISQNEKKFELLNNIIQICNQNYNDYLIWINYLEEYVNSIVSTEFDDLINNVELNDNESIEKLLPLFATRNYFKINSFDEIDNYDEIKNKICDFIISGDDEKILEYEYISKLDRINQLKFAVLEKLYGQDLDNSKRLFELFGYDIDSIESHNSEEEDLILYIKSLRVILYCNDEELLKKLYEIPINVKKENIKPWIIERKLKNIFSKDYNNGLYNPQEHECDRVEDDIPIYEAGTNFKMVMTSIGAFAGNTASGKDYYDAWNREKNTTLCFSTSYITNEMIGTASIRDICYGFCNMKEDALVEASPWDLGSRSDSHKSTTDGGSVFLSPENQINYVTPFWGFNELVYKRIQNGERKQPDYILVFRQKGLIENMDKAKKASKSFGNLPIVIVDKDECCKSELQKLSEMIKTYNENKDIDIFEAILQKAKKNLVITGFKEQLEDFIVGKFDEKDEEKIKDIINYMSDYDYFNNTGGVREEDLLNEKLKKQVSSIKINNSDEKNNIESQIKCIAREINRVLICGGDDRNDR